MLQVTGWMVVPLIKRGTLEEPVWGGEDAFGLDMGPVKLCKYEAKTRQASIWKSSAKAERVGRYEGESFCVFPRHNQYIRDGHIFVLWLLRHTASFQGDLSYCGHGFIYEHLFVFYFLT